MIDATLMDRAIAADAAWMLWRLWSSGETITALPPTLRPATLEDGWRIQRAMDVHAGPPAGWKIAATSAAGQAHIGADGPLAGRLYRRCLVDSGDELDAGALTMRVAEAEFAFRMAADVPGANGPPDRARVLAAVGALVPAIEVPDTRFEDMLSAGLPSMLADALCCGFLVVGDDVDDWDADALAAHAVNMRRNGVTVARGHGRDVLGDPVDALVWLARHLHERGLGLRAGDVVTTGACTPAKPIASGDALTAEFGAFGEVTVRFAGGRP
jgi:2-keto-4-pentenoate hydratase